MAEPVCFLTSIYKYEMIVPQIDKIVISLNILFSLYTQNIRSSIIYNKITWLLLNTVAIKHGCFMAASLQYDLIDLCWEVANGNIVVIKQGGIGPYDGGMVAIKHGRFEAFSWPYNRGHT